jgi:hypothetical protein
MHTHAHAHASGLGFRVEASTALGWSAGVGGIARKWFSLVSNVFTKWFSLVINVFRMECGVGGIGIGQKEVGLGKHITN